MEEKTALMSKKLDELTVGDQLKITAVAMGVTVAIYAAAYGGLMAYVKFAERRAQRKFEKDVRTLNETRR